MAPRNFELEVAGLGGEGVGGITGLRFRMLGQESIGRVFPENGFDAARAQAPFVVNEGVDEETLAGVEHDLGSGEDAVLEGVEAGCVGTSGGARVCGL
jgi:hypothetical protein